MIGTYQGKWEDGSIAQGGYANFMRCRGHFAIPIPEKLDSESAAPLLCAGATTYSVSIARSDIRRTDYVTYLWTFSQPLRRFGAGPGKRVGIIGIGGLGHVRRM